MGGPLSLRRDLLVTFLDDDLLNAPPSPLASPEALVEPASKATAAAEMDLEVTKKEEEEEEVVQESTEEAAEKTDLEVDWGAKLDAIRKASSQRLVENEEEEEVVVQEATEQAAEPTVSELAVAEENVPAKSEETRATDVTNTEKKSEKKKGSKKGKKSEKKKGSSSDADDKADDK